MIGISCKMKTYFKLFMISLIFGWVPAYAADTAQSTQTIKIEANNLKISKDGNEIIYKGNVIAIRDNVTIHADQIKVISDNDEIQTIHATGTPATLYKNDPIEPFNSSASLIIWHAKSDKLTMKGKAKAQQKDNHLQSETIIYNLNDNVLEAGGGNSRVITTINPEQEQ